MFSCPVGATTVAGLVSAPSAPADTGWRMIPQALRGGCPLVGQPRAMEGATFLRALCHPGADQGELPPLRKYPWCGVFGKSGALGFGK